MSGNVTLLNFIPHAHLFGACLINYSLIRRRNNAPLSQAFTGGLPPLERRGASNLVNDVHLFGAEPQQAATV